MEAERAVRARTLRRAQVQLQLVRHVLQAATVPQRVALICRYVCPVQQAGTV